MSTSSQTVKSRCRRRALVLCLAPLALALLTGTGYVWFANQLPPVEKEERLFPYPNGFDVAVEIASRIPMLPKESPVHDPQADQTALDRALAPHRPVLAELRTTLKLEYMNPLVSDFQEPFSYLARYREAARMMAAESRLARMRGQPAPAAGHALDIIEFASRVGNGGPLIQRLVMIAIASIGIAQLEASIPSLSADEAAAAGARLETLVPRFPTAAQIFEEERFASQRGMRTAFKDPDYVNSFTDKMGEPPGFTSHLKWFIYPKRWACLDMDAQLRERIAELEQPYPQRQEWEQRRWWTSPYLVSMSEILLPVFSRVEYKVEQNTANLRLMRVSLALQHHLGRTGEYPPTLDDLKSITATEMLVDPFADAPFRYVKNWDGIQLYSVGPNMIDDGGRPLDPKARGTRPPGDLVAGRLYANDATR